MATKTKPRAKATPTDVIDDSMNAAEKMMNELIKTHITGTPKEGAYHLGTTAGGADYMKTLGEMRHTRYSGMTNMGKTYAAIRIFKQMAADPEIDLHIYSADLDDYRDAGLGKDAALIKSLGQFRDAIYSLSEEIETRAKSGLPRESYKPIVMAIDEFEDMMIHLKEIGDKKTENALKKIAARGVKRQIYLHLISQTVHKRVYSGSLGNNIFTDIVFRAPDRYTSDMTLGSREATKLEPYEYIVKHGADQFKMLPLWDKKTSK